MLNKSKKTGVFIRLDGLYTVIHFTTDLFSMLFYDEWIVSFNSLLIGVNLKPKDFNCDFFF